MPPESRATTQTSSSKLGARPGSNEKELKMVVKEAFKYPSEAFTALDGVKQDRSREGDSFFFFWRGKVHARIPHGGKVPWHLQHRAVIEDFQMIFAEHMSRVHIASSKMTSPSATKEDTFHDFPPEKLGYSCGRGYCPSS